MTLPHHSQPLHLASFTPILWTWTRTHTLTPAQSLQSTWFHSTLSTHSGILSSAPTCCVNISHITNKVYKSRSDCKCAMWMTKLVPSIKNVPAVHKCLPRTMDQVFDGLGFCFHFGRYWGLCAGSSHWRSHICLDLRPAPWDGAHTWYC